MDLGIAQKKEMHTPACYDPPPLVALTQLYETAENALLPLEKLSCCPMNNPTQDIQGNIVNY
jgi:hypothetical protein